MSMYRKVATALCAGAVAVTAISCKESRQDRPVMTTTDQGTQTAPSGASAERRDQTLVRVINAVPDSKLDVWADDQKAFGSVDYKTVTDYQPFAQNQITFRLHRSGQDAQAEPLATNNELVSDGSYHTIVIVPNEGKENPDLRIVSDEQTPTEAGKARVRMINAAAGVGDIDLVPAGQDPIFDGVNFKREAGYKDVDPVTVPLSVKSDAKNTVLTKLGDHKLEAGKTYTIVVAGKAPGKVEAITVQDQLSTASAGAKRTGQ